MNNKLRMPDVVFYLRLIACLYLLRVAGLTLHAEAYGTPSSDLFKSLFGTDNAIIIYSMLAYLTFFSFYLTQNSGSRRFVAATLLVLSLIVVCIVAMNLLTWGDSERYVYRSLLTTWSIIITACALFGSAAYYLVFGHKVGVFFATRSSNEELDLQSIADFNDSIPPSIVLVSRAVTAILLVFGLYQFLLGSALPYWLGETEFGVSLEVVGRVLALFILAMMTFYMRRNYILTWIIALLVYVGASGLIAYGVYIEFVTWERFLILEALASLGLTLLALLLIRQFEWFRPKKTQLRA